jgi:hypothetical protein
MQAATTFHSANFDDYGYGSNDNPYTGYSAESHGTYGQPAMSHGGHAESYAMNDVGMSMGVGGNGSAGAGYEYAAAGIGAAGGAVAMQSARSRKSTHTAGFGAGGASDYPGYKEQTPYPAFTGPGPQPHEIYDQGGGVPGLGYRRGPGSQEADLL